MTSRREHPTDPTGAPPAHRKGRTGPGEPATRESGTPHANEPHLDGLFTYCLSVMCEHEAALAALGETLILADRQHARGRAPQDATATRPWLYALARWACLRRLAHRAAACAGTTFGTGRVADGPAPCAPGPGKTPGVPASPAAGHTLLDDATRARRRRELATLAWPEAAGTTAEQREALELSVRHRLTPAQIGAVLSMSTGETEDLLMKAACEVERTRAALRVVESGGCPAVTRLAGDDRLLLGTALRRELVRHVDECPQCRRAAERAMAGVSWPGTAPATATLALVEAPRRAVDAAVELARGARAQRTPRFDRNGFPVCDPNRPARRERLRGRALASTVVAAVLTAPVFALWTASRGAPVAGEQADRSAAAPEEPHAHGGAPAPGGGTPGGVPDRGRAGHGPPTAGDGAPLPWRAAGPGAPKAPDGPGAAAHGGTGPSGSRAAEEHAGAGERTGKGARPGAQKGAGEGEAPPSAVRSPSSLFAAPALRPAVPQAPAAPEQDPSPTDSPSSSSESTTPHPSSPSPTGSPS
ncbi:hypothetical protein G3260_004049 [Streptomyces albus]|uniref:Uncharacterized protein n=1 Tax=Streptomyces albus TaxID=1888 RepID=A0A6C1CBL0_9ACTN|nr:MULTISPECIES: hypothetical protein [Streptomyces]QID40263.1 hypothetical protein G3260_004049 [Streptomyces albus]TGG81952.1 hypothetical protein D8771_17635 [Streptomyces albus]